MARAEIVKAQKIPAEAELSIPKQVARARMAGVNAGPLGGD
jgi:hypothetical protein